jgi:hypothetical protein
MGYRTSVWLTRISHTASAASCRLRRPAGCSASRLSPLRSGCCGPPPLRSGPNFPWTVGSHAVRREPPGGKSGPRVDARGTLRATLRVVSLRLTSLCSVYLRYAPIHSGCGDSSSPRLATKQYEKCGLAVITRKNNLSGPDGSHAWGKRRDGEQFRERGAGVSDTFPKNDGARPRRGVDKRRSQLAAPSTANARPDG